MTTRQPARLPARPTPMCGEALDSYLERAAAANGLTRPGLLATLGPGASTAWLTHRPDRNVRAVLAVLLAQPPVALEAMTTEHLAGLHTNVLASGEEASTTWRTAAGRGWAPGRGSQACPACLADAGAWQLNWRHPWATTCLVHGTWLLAGCPTCRRPFRHRYSGPLHSVDSASMLCGNPGGRRGAACRQPLAGLPAMPADGFVLASQHRIQHAIGGGSVLVLAESMSPGDYLAEVKALAVLLLHLAVQPGGDRLADWADSARSDAPRSPGDRAARWVLAPPADPWLRGHALAAADRILDSEVLDHAADRFHPWTQLTPNLPDGQLGWLADHTRMTPTLTRLVMAATATRRRISTLLDQPAPRPLPLKAIPQVLPMGEFAPAALYLDGDDEISRAYVSMCLGRRHSAGITWAEAGALLGVPPNVAVTVARTASGRMLCTPLTWIRAIDEIASGLDAGLDRGIDYRRREVVVRRLAAGSRWYRRWARTHHPGSRATSRRYALIWLWTTWAGGLLCTTPTCQSVAAVPASPDHAARAGYRRWAARVPTEALAALIEAADDTASTTVTNKQRTRRTP